MSRYLIILSICLLAAASRAHLHAAEEPPRTSAGADLARITPPAGPPKAPVAFFRELLATNTSGRELLLAGRSPQARQAILGKIREYEALPPKQRELRLRVTELRYYLRPLMAMAPGERAARLGGIPADIRPLIEVRLQRWDQLPQAERTSLLENEAAARNLVEFAFIMPTQTQLPRSQREAMERAMAQWQRLSPEQQRAITASFKSYFHITPEEQDKILITISEPERQEIQHTLQKYKALDSSRRVQCVQALTQLARLSPEERRDFLRSAEGWQRMSPEERKAWRDFVNRQSQQPPLPTGFGAPPLPPGASRPQTTPRPSIATNR